jgi:hypothetical protein
MQLGAIGMRQSIWSVFVIVPLALQAGFCWGADATQSSGTNGQVINYKEMDRVQIIGKLGLPLGQLVTVHGQWQPPASAVKPSGPEFVVDTINGKSLSPPAVFEEVEQVSGPNNNVKPIVGDEWELRGVEKGEFIGFSGEVWTEVGHFANHGESGFQTKFCFIKARQLNGNAKPR